MLPLTSSTWYPTLGAGRPDQIVTAVGQLGHHLIRCSIRAGLVRILHRQRCGHTAYLSDGRIVDNLVAPLGVELFIVHHVQLYCLVTSLCHDAGRRIEVTGSVPYGHPASLHEKCGTG